MRRDAGDIIDRLSIAILKLRRIGTSNTRREFEMFMEGFHELFYKYPEVQWEQHLVNMIQVNSDIWDLEFAVRQGQLDRDPEEVGRRAISIRMTNGSRVALKNTINNEVSEGVQDVKTDHVSAGATGKE